MNSEDGKNVLVRGRLTARIKSDTKSNKMGTFPFEIRNQDVAKGILHIPLNNE